MIVSALRSKSNRITTAWRAFLRLYTCFALISGFSGTFMNTYLLRATGNNDGVMLFNIVLAAVQPFAMVISVYLMRKKSALFTQSIGMWLYAIAFMILIIFGESTVPYIQWVSATLSAANGFFYTTYALQLLAYTEDKNRDACYGIQNALGGVIGIVLPFMTGLLLVAFEDFSGYRIIFSMGLIISLVAVFVDRKLMPVTNVSPKAHIGQTLKVLVTKKPARAAMFSSMAIGFYSGTMAFYLSMLIYEIVKNEAVIGAMNTAGSILAIFSSMLYAKIVRPNNRMKVIFIALGITILGAVFLLFDTSLAVLVIFNLVLTSISGFFLNPPLMAYFGVVENLPELKGLGSEVHTLREFWYGGGRVLGILMTMLLSNLQNGVGFVILIILLVQIIPAVLMKQMKV